MCVEDIEVSLKFVVIKNNSSVFTVFFRWGACSITVKIKLPFSEKKQQKTKTGVS